MSSKTGAAPYPSLSERPCQRRSSGLYLDAAELASRRSAQRDAPFACADRTVDQAFDSHGHDNHPCQPRSLDRRTQSRLEALSSDAPIDVQGSGIRPASIWAVSPRSKGAGG